MVRNRKSIAWCGSGVVLGILLWAVPVMAAEQPEDAPPHERLDAPLPPEDGLDPPPPDDRGPHRWREGRAGAMLWERMSDEERTAVRAFLAEEYPDRYDMLLEIEERDPEGTRPFLGRILPEIIRMKELKERDPELFAVRRSEQQAEFELRRLARRYRISTDEAERAELAEQIRPLVEKQFDVRQRRLEEEVSRLEERIDQLRARIAEQASNRDAEVEALYQRILEEGPRGVGRPDDGERRGNRPRRGHRGKPADRPISAVPEPDDE